MVHAHDIAAAIVVFTGIVGLVLFGLSWNAYRTTRNEKMLFLIVAFALFSVKSFFMAFALWRGSPGHEDLEMIDAIGDLGVVFLLIAPIFLRRRSE